MKLFDGTLGRLERALDVRMLEHNVLAGNVANVDTPGFAPKEVDFAAAMAYVAGGQGSDASMTATDPDHIGATSAGGGGGIAAVAVHEAAGASASIDGNKVDLDRTMVALAENGMQYGASARAAAKKLAILRYVATEGGG
jgi:flagellar basal-body rod protein FlgB